MYNVSIIDETLLHIEKSSFIKHVVGWIGARFPDCDFFYLIGKKYECHSNMPQPSCQCTVSLKLAKVERLNI